LDTEIEIRPFADDDAPQIRKLFIGTNRLLSPPDLRDAFEACIERALGEEIDRITDYYREHDGGFWVAIQNDGPVGTFGLERAAHDAMELRRMYVDAAARRNGIGRRMLQYAEDKCRRRNIARLELSTVEIQSAAIALYKNAGYQLLREDIAELESNKTVGSGLRRLYFQKIL
jgi:GNAT superfamily N-acetyltransferase